MGKLGAEIADMVGPPDSKSKKYAKSDAEDAADGGDDEESEDSGGQEDAELSAMEEFEGAGDAKAKLEAFKKLLDIVG